jgi:hypothetical protein
MKALFDVLVPGERDYGLALAIDPDRLLAGQLGARFRGLGDTVLEAHLDLR